MKMQEQSDLVIFTTTFTENIFDKLGQVVPVFALWQQQNNTSF